MKRFLNYITKPKTGRMLFDLLMVLVSVLLVYADPDKGIELPTEVNNYILIAGGVFVFDLIIQSIRKFKNWIKS